jgi:hypothetical protein
MTPNEQELHDQLEADTRLQPGDNGWWRVWGAGPLHAKPGDIIVTMNGDELTFDEVVDVIPREMRVVFVKPDGSVFRMGMGFRGLMVFRRGTKNVLA